MAKKGSLKAALATVTAYGKGLQHEATADYKVAMSASAAGTAGLSAQTRALTRNAVLSAKQNAAAVQSLAARAAAVQGGVNRSQAGSVSRYGAGLAGSIASSYGVADATAAAGAKIVAGQAKQAGAGVRLAQGVGKLAAQGVKAQSGAAAYAMAQALQQRNIADNATVGELTAHLYETKMQEDAAWSLWKRQQDYAAKKAGDGTKEGVLRLINEGTDIAAGAADVWRKNNTADTLDEMDITNETSTWAQANGYDPAGPEAALFAATLRNLKADPKANTATAWSSAVTTLYQGSKGWDQWGQAALDSGQSKMAGTLLNNYNTYYSDLYGGGGDAPNGKDMGGTRSGDPVYHYVTSSSTKPGDSVSDGIGNIGVVQPNGTVKWLS